MEYDRIKIVQQRIGNENKYDGFDSTIDKKGAGEYFLNYDFLNYEVLGEPKDEQFLKKYLYNDLGRLEDLSKYDLDLNTAINLAIDNLIEKRVNQITEKIKQDWLDLGVYSKTDKGELLNDRFKELASSTNYSEGMLTNQAKDTLLNLLSELGINMSSQGLNSWLQNDSNYKDSKLRRDKEHLKYTLAYVFANVAGESKKTVVSEDEDVITKNNPFENEAKHIESLAYQESSFSKVQGGSSFRHDGKQYSSFVRHMPLETQLNNMKQLFNQSVGAIKNGLTSKPVFQHSFYAQQLDKVSPPFILSAILLTVSSDTSPVSIKWLYSISL